MNNNLTLIINELKREAPQSKETKMTCRDNRKFRAVKRIEIVTL